MKLAPLCFVACLAGLTFAEPALADVPCDDFAPALQAAGAGGAGGEAGSGNPEPRPRGNRCSGDDGCSVDRVGKAGRAGKFGLAALMALAGAGALFADRRRGG
ncbi:MAG TPA: hypothetical protein VFS43_43815 [Polyangiaceae bacterium]|nr:hypothetical protein [Polyangiaceae bacterium]